jgi:hypothetical protein
MSASIPTKLGKHLFFYGDILKGCASGKPTWYKQEAAQAMLEELCEILNDCGETTLAEHLKGGTK